MVSKDKFSGTARSMQVKIQTRRTKNRSPKRTSQKSKKIQTTKMIKRRKLIQMQKEMLKKRRRQKIVPFRYTFSSRIKSLPISLKIRLP